MAALLFRGDEVDIVHLPHVLQLDEPFTELFRSQIEPAADVGNVVVLAEDAAEVAHAEEDGAGTVVSLDARFLAEVRGDSVDLDRFCTDQADPGGLIAVYGAQTGAEVAV